MVTGLAFIQCHDLAGKPFNLGDSRVFGGPRLTATYWRGALELDANQTRPASPRFPHSQSVHPSPTTYFLGSNRPLTKVSW